MKKEKYILSLPKNDIKATSKTGKKKRRKKKGVRATIAYFGGTIEDSQ